MREKAVHQVEIVKDQWDRFSAHLSMRRKVELSCKVLITPALYVLPPKFCKFFLTRVITSRHDI